MTAKEFFNKWNLDNYFQSGNEYQLLSLLNDYAKYHVEQALKVASENADITDNGRFPIIDKQSILNAYSLKNIK